MASPLLSAGRRDAAVWTSRLRSGNFVWRHVLNMCPSASCRLAFAQVVAAAAVRCFCSTMGLLCSVVLRGRPKCSLCPSHFPRWPPLLPTLLRQAPRKSKSKIQDRRQARCKMSLGLAAALASLYCFLVLAVRMWQLAGAYEQFDAPCTTIYVLCNQLWGS